MDVLIKVLQVVAALSILVLVHEFGHFFFARLFRIRVEKFYLFFNPWFTLFKYKPKGSETEYGIGWLPLGGYCKIAGMIDESMDTEALKQEPQPWEFRSRPAWQRFFVMFGGVFFNFILAIIIYSATLYTWGEEYLKNDNAIYGVQCNDLALEIGFRHGDRILKVDGVAVDKFQDIQIDIARNQARSVAVLRGNDTVDIPIDQKYIPAILNTPGMFGLRVPFEVLSVPDSSLNKGLIFPGDRIVGIDSVNTFIIQDIQSVLQRKSQGTVGVNIERNGSIVNTVLTVDSLGRLGIFLNSDMKKFFEVTTVNYTLLSSIPAGASRTISTLTNYVKELGLIFSPKTEAYKSVGSFITIGKIFPSSWVWEIFWNITAWLSIMLAVINLIPIPALDGGHILFVLYEMITRRKPSDKFLEYAQIAGLIIILGLVFLSFGNDIYRLFK
jgi:regulator of sigma E protease